MHMIILDVSTAPAGMTPRVKTKLSRRLTKSELLLLPFPDLRSSEHRRGGPIGDRSPAKVRESSGRETGAAPAVQ
jgi:hypothetical protein